MLNGVAWSHALMGDYQQARATCDQSLALIAKLGGCHFEGDVWDTLGYIEFHLGDFARAAGHFESALAAYDERAPHRSVHPCGSRQMTSPTCEPRAAEGGGQPTSPRRARGPAHHLLNPRLRHAGG